MSDRSHTPQDYSGEGPWTGTTVRLDDRTGVGPGSPGGYEVDIGKPADEARSLMSEPVSWISPFHALWGVTSAFGFGHDLTPGEDTTREGGRHDRKARNGPSG